MTTPSAGAEPLHLRVAHALAGRVEPMGLTEFWSMVAQLGWGSRLHEPKACGAELAEKFSPQQLLAMRERFALLDGQLAKAVELWALQHEESLGLPADLQRELRAHLIGLGEIPFGAAVQGPWRAKHRAERDDYLEGFWRVFELALEKVPAEQLQALVASGAI